MPAARARDRRCGSSQIDNGGFSARPSDDKRTKWCSRIRAALRSGQLSAGAAKKLTGALSWATSHTFRRIGRATLRPLLDHSHRRNPILREDARCSLTWWLDVLERGVAEHAAWEAREPAAPPLLLWADARGSPARIAAVLYADGSWLYTDLAPDPDVMRQFMARGDNQIAGLEMLAVALGVSTWDRLIQGRSLRVFSDNTVAEWGFRKGTARELDHAALVHTFWLAMAALHVSVHIDRVPTGARRRGACVVVSYAKRADDNIADDPSRESYESLAILGAQIALCGTRRPPPRRRG